MDETYMRKMQGINVVMAQELPQQIRDTKRIWWRRRSSRAEG